MTGAFVTGSVVTSAQAAPADKEQIFRTDLHNHRFDPATITIPAGTRVRVLVQNSDPTPEEFESEDLDIEKIIPGNSIAAVSVGPLKPGSYSFYGEFHEDTAKGNIVVKAKGK